MALDMGHGSRGTEAAVKVVWTVPALDDLEEIRAWIGREDARVARLVGARILDAIDVLESQPNLGRPGRVVGTREFAAPKTPFVVFYRVTPDAVEILRVLRGRRSTLPEI